MNHLEVMSVSIYAGSNGCTTGVFCAAPTNSCFFSVFFFVPGQVRQYPSGNSPLRAADLSVCRNAEKTRKRSTQCLRNAMRRHT